MMLKNVFFAGAAALTMASAAQAEEHMVVLTGFSYFPSVVYANPGDTVRFRNESGEQQTVVAKDADWIVGPLENEAEGTLVVNEETELKFYASYGGADCAGAHDGQDGNCGFGNDPTVEDEHGDYEGAPIKAEITFDTAPLTDTASLSD